jgi:Zn-finger nucleic acid-binding protein
MSTLPTPACPTCRSDLALTADRGFDAWVCPHGHGLAFTLSEAYARLADADIQEIWSAARYAPRGRRGCPMCEATMVTVPCEGVALDVCVTDEVLWFDTGELEALPPDAPAPPPDPREEAALESVTDRFGDALDAGWDAEERHTITGRLMAVLDRVRGTSSAGTR